MILNTVFWIITTSLTICWSLPFIFAPIIGLQFYKVSEQKLIKLLKILSKSSKIFWSSISYNDDPEGWIIGWPFLGYIHNSISTNGDEKKTLYIFTIRKFFNKKIKEINNFGNDIKIDNPELKIKIWERQGNFYCLRYSHRDFDVSNFKSRPNQSKVINKIKEFYSINKYCVVLLHGEKGTGKSMIPILLAKSLLNDEINNINFCDTFKPTEPGDSFNTLYTNINPSKDSPLIVVLEEFNITINQIHYNKIVSHKHIPISVVDKPSWNQFLDRFDRKYFPWVILVLTSNVSPENINILDPSYIRNGRVNLIFKIKN